MWWSIDQFSTNWKSGFSKFWGFWYKLYAQVNFVILNLNWTCSHCIRACIMTLYYSCIIYIFFYIFFVLTCSLPLVFFFLFFLVLSLCLVLTLAPCLGRLEPIGQPPLHLSLPFRVSCFRVRKTRSCMRLWTLRERFGLSVRFY